LQEGLLVPVLPDHPLPGQEVRALVVEQRAMASLVGQFLDFIEDELPGALENPSKKLRFKPDGGEALPRP